MAVSIFLCAVVLYIGIGSLSKANAQNFLRKEQLRFVESYDERVPPTPPKGGPLLVNISICIRKILEVNEEQSEITMTWYFRQSWNEPRLNISRHMFAANNSYVSMDNNMADTFWTPDFFIEQARTFQQQNLHSRIGSLRIYSDNQLARSTPCEISLLCQMDFHLYPLDKQRCIIRIMSYAYNHRLIVIDWYGKINLPLEFVKGWNQASQFDMTFSYSPTSLSEVYNGERYSYIALEMNMTRKLTPHLLQTYLPSTIFVIMSWIGFLVDPDTVPGRMVLLVTTMLTLISMYTSVRLQSPKTTGLKCIEVWIIACILFVFAALAEYALILGHICKGRQSKMTETIKVAPTTRQTPKIISDSTETHYSMAFIDKLSLFLFPFSFAIFSLAYWSVYL